MTEENPDLQESAAMLLVDLLEERGLDIKDVIIGVRFQDDSAEAYWSPMDTDVVRMLQALIYKEVKLTMYEVQDSAGIRPVEKR